MKESARLALVLIVLSLVMTACGDSSVTALPTSTAPVPNNTLLPPTSTTLATSITTLTTPTAQPLAATWARDGVCYSLLVRSFYDSNGDGKGDLQGLISKLDYFNDGNPKSTQSLGVNCLWLLPVVQSPSYHGYDTTDYYKVNPDYGTNDDFKKLVQEAHKRGINIIIDLVLNHTSVEHPWFKQASADPKSPYRDWYVFSDTDPGYGGPPGMSGKVWHKNPNGPGYYYGVFSSTMPDLNLRNPAVTKQMNDVARFWLQDMGVDGFRMDAVKHLIENGQTQVDTSDTHTWLRDFHQYLTSIKPDVYTIGEVSSPSTLRGYYPDQLDAYFEFSLAQSVVNSARTGSASFVGLVKDANKNWPQQRYGSFLTNHDQNRVMDTLGGNLSKMKIAATAYLTLPGLPFVYYGEEIGMTGSKPDEQIRTPMQWTSDPATGGFTTGKPWEPLNDNTAKFNVQTENDDPNSLLNLYRKLINLRRAIPALSRGDFQPLSSGQYGLAAYLRQSGDSAALVLINLSDEAIKDLKLTVDSSTLTPGKYKPTVQFSLNNPATTLPDITIENGGTITGYTPGVELSPYSALILTLSR